MDEEFFCWDISEVPVERITGFFKGIINNLWIQFLNGDLSKPRVPAETNYSFSA